MKCMLLRHAPHAAKKRTTVNGHFRRWSPSPSPFFQSRSASPSLSQSYSTINTTSTTSTALSLSSLLINPTRKVTFSNRVQAKRILPSRKYSRKEREATWYNAEELKAIRTDVKNLVESMNGTLDHGNGNTSRSSSRAFSFHEDESVRVMERFVPYLLNTKRTKMQQV